LNELKGHRKYIEIFRPHLWIQSDYGAQSLRLCHSSSSSLGKIFLFFPFMQRGEAEPIHVFTVTLYTEIMDGELLLRTHF